MCLSKKSYIPRIALRDMTVYKTILRESSDGKYKSLFMEAPVRLNQSYTGKFKKFSNIFRSLFSRFVMDGFIHSYTSISCARVSKMLHTYHYVLSTPVIVECLIPKGTIYFIGKRDEIASRKLKYIEIIK